MKPETDNLNQTKQEPRVNTGDAKRCRKAQHRVNPCSSVVSDPDYLTFAAQAVLEHLERVTREVDGVRKADDIECVHHMRVASRRLRTALRLFENCFPRKPFRRWQKEMRAITRALGRARDLDVQIEFVQAFEPHRHDARNRPGVKRLLLRLCQKREKVQRKVLRRLADFEACGVSESMHAVLSPLKVQAQDGERPPSPTSQTGQTGPTWGSRSPVLLEDARTWIQHGLDELLEYEPYVAKPRAIKELHAMRIAAKHLRYTLEIFEPLFGETQVKAEAKAEKEPIPLPLPLPAALEAAKQVQTFLGDLHDCDVWLELLPRFMDRESKRCLNFHGHHRAFRRLTPGIEHFRRRVIRLRRRTYRQFAAYWQETRSKKVWEELAKVVLDT